MNWRRGGIALTTLNLLILLVDLAMNLAGVRPAAQALPQVLRGRGLEIVDDQGRMRAEIKVFPAQPTLKMPDGTVGYPETVLLRLINSKGAPNVKLATLEDGSAFGLNGENDGHIQLLSRSGDPVIKIVRNGRGKTIK